MPFTIPRIAGTRFSLITWPAAWIAAGLLMLLAAGRWPIVPAVTGMAFVALGATAATIARYRRTPALLPVILMHLAVYGGLYTLFVGATLHAANTRHGPRIDAVTIFDVVTSVAPMLVAVRIAWDALRADGACDA